ncbi:hypothetical protein VC83_06505 [Pseudogymnoascus destructans]|uniref:Thioredoxin-like fold domain-containing protein n=2 Tax=Pseudogymnoascus destructans TaxID=655981 RepID=L8GAC5_PSED2|nr:uncharacterized protein VC83_06505 [Pseudogymnoascus destructans]ELR09849.1 hypothetical protein GMDG_04329 [Pseudogymnoascus destructans 20631-21]OAF58283.1 hypothetical protein VC83_06505 [Pseudogymnoascus destructans]
MTRGRPAKTSPPALSASLYGNRTLKLWRIHQLPSPPSTSSANDSRSANRVYARRPIPFSTTHLGAYTWSPFVVKLEARLRFSHLPYTTEDCPSSSSICTYGSFPFGDAVSVPTCLPSDSALITKSLIKSAAITDLNADLSPAEAATDLAIRSLLEDKLYFLNGHEHWITNFYTMRDIGPLSTIPCLPRLIIGQIVYSKITRTLHGQGTGRYSPAEIAALRLETWMAPHALVGEGWVLGLDGPTDVDAFLFGFLVSSLTASANPETKAIIQGLPYLMGYAERVHEYFSGYKMWE